jgi:hypothetical protein
MRILKLCNKELKKFENDHFQIFLFLNTEIQIKGSSFNL